MKYENIDAFAERVGKSRRTIHRFYNKNPELKQDRKKKGRKVMYPINHAKFWNTEVMFDENKTLNDSNRKMRNLLDYLHGNKNALANKFWGLDWTYFVSVDYKHERSKNYSITKIIEL